MFLLLCVSVSVSLLSLYTTGLELQHSLSCWLPAAAANNNHNSILRSMPLSDLAKTLCSGKGRKGYDIGKSFNLLFIVFVVICVRYFAYYVIVYDDKAY